MGVSVGTMQLTLSIAIMQLTTYVATMLVLRFSCSSVSGILCYSYVGGSFFMQLEVSAALMEVSFCSKYVGDSFYFNYGGWRLCCSYGGRIF